MAHAKTGRRGFTLIELLVVVAVIGLLIAVLLPALGSAQRSARAVACASNMRSIGQGFMIYSNDHDGIVVPSYTMTGTSGAGVKLEGWAPILDRDDYIRGVRNIGGSAFTCPDTLDIEGMRDGQTGLDLDKPKGWMDWPNIRTGVQNIATTIPERGFHRTIRVSYWINADNPIGNVTDFVQDMYFTGSVGYGRIPQGPVMGYTRLHRFRQPVNLIMISDGVYAGRQRDNRIGTQNSRIGYRHRHGGEAAANVAFADGHVRPLKGTEFPRGLGGDNTVKTVREENTHGQPTVFSDPERLLRLPGN